MTEAMNRHYESGVEATRLSGPGRLEFLRTMAIVERHLPEPPQAVADIGGGPGVYATALASAGYRVHLLDAMPLHIEQANDAAAVRGLSDAVTAARFL